MKTEQELKTLEKKISKSNAPSKTKPVTAPMFRDTGAKAYVDRAAPAQRDLQCPFEVEE